MRRGLGYPSRASVRSSIVAVKYIRIAGIRMGKAAAVARLKAWFNSGAEYAPLSEEVALKAGELSLRHTYVPITDTIIAATALSPHAKVVSDDLYFNALRIDRIWYK